MIFAVQLRTNKLSNYIKSLPYTPAQKLVGWLVDTVALMWVELSFQDPLVEDPVLIHILSGFPKTKKTNASCNHHLSGV